MKELVGKPCSSTTSGAPGGPASRENSCRPFTVA